MAGAIEIIATPKGEAPLWVREAWIGLVLPLPPGRSYGAWWVTGVLGGPRSRLGFAFALLRGKAWRETGYLVSSIDAIHLLAEHRPDAAEWWRTHTRFAGPGNPGFLFDAPACRPID